MNACAAAAFNTRSVYLNIGSITWCGHLKVRIDARIITNDGASIPGKQVGRVGQQESNTAVKSAVGVEHAFESACVQRQIGTLRSTTTDAGTYQCGAFDDCDGAAGSATGGNQTQGTAGGVPDGAVAQRE
ncbi:hypothetical protein AAHH21_15460 [Stenotrophomonas sp. BSUC-16]|uniref:hypothetical protein n=1 Tax=Stenotrophomonas TaxID=40323 RepID=UPI0011B71FD7|nr:MULTISPECIES: hypothetical protein [Stenotrophomonas maltophilia group]MDJ1625227.1 hypothetical protein [Stenotrophomonas sepilia]MDT3489821.1 hypothetical protein [Stenotrophomonas maltophilia group sp. msm4]UXB34551.1 hypothetical protein K7563_11405 [Stenotrophomonas maltophilia]